MKKTILGPGGLRVILDTDEIVPDDPGQGTPAIVEGTKGAQRGHGSTLDCATDTGELDCGAAMLTPAQCEWLNSAKLRAEVDAFFVGTGY